LSSSVVGFPPGFFTRGALAVAQDLLGCMLVRRMPAGSGLPAGSVLTGVIAETEAYLPDDPACHAHRGRTARNAAMFLSGGHAYVYFIYGMHFCVNVVTGPEGQGEAVLLRAVRGAPVAGCVLSGTLVPSESGALTNDLIPDAQTTGPGRLCRVFGIDRALDGADLTDPAGPLYLLPRTGPPPPFSATPRIGIRKNADVPWRFVMG
jgi:DNA-3-methyladenine glycosylase